MAAAKIFAIGVKNNPSEKVRLVKALSKAQVTRYLLSTLVIETPSAVDVAELLSAGETKVEDATLLDQEESTAAGGGATGQGSGDPSSQPANAGVAPQLGGEGEGAAVHPSAAAATA